MDYKDTKKAVALQYDNEAEPPKVIAKGRGLVAHRIIENASELGIPLVKAPEQAEELSRVFLGDHIPPELYQAIAEIYAFLMDIDEDLERK